MGLRGTKEKYFEVYVFHFFRRKKGVGDISVIVMAENNDISRKWFEGSLILLNLKVSSNAIKISELPFTIPPHSPYKALNVSGNDVFLVVQCVTCTLTKKCEC